MTRRDEDHESLADQLDEQADQLEQRNEELGDDVDEVRQDWRRKRADQAVPGAVPPPEDEASAEGNQAPAEREADDAEAEESGQ